MVSKNVDNSQKIVFIGNKTTWKSTTYSKYEAVAKEKND